MSKNNLRASLLALISTSALAAVTPEFLAIQVAKQAMAAKNTVRLQNLGDVTNADSRQSNYGYEIQIDYVVPGQIKGKTCRFVGWFDFNGQTISCQDYVKGLHSGPSLCLDAPGCEIPEQPL